jgi:hypothetical protein
VEYVRKNGGARLIERLEAKGHYPYWDLHRESVAEPGGDRSGEEARAEHDRVSKGGSANTSDWG